MQLRKPSPHLFTKDGCYFDLREIVTVGVTPNDRWPFSITFRSGKVESWAKTTGGEVMAALKLYHEAHHE